jgi:hypothetical protein
MRPLAIVDVEHHDAWPILAAIDGAAVCFMAPEIGVADRKSDARLGQRHALRLDFVIESVRLLSDLSGQNRLHLLVA